MTAFPNVENLQQYNCTHSLTVERILTLASSTNLVREVKNISLNFVTMSFEKIDQFYFGILSAKFL